MLIIDIWIQTTDKDLIDLLTSILDSPYANYLTRQYVLAGITKMSARNTTTSAQQERIAEVLANYTTSPELELQQRSVEFVSLFNLGAEREGVLERMPPPELKATVMGVGKPTFVQMLDYKADCDGTYSERKQTRRFNRPGTRPVQR